MSKRSGIVDALVTELQKIDGNAPYSSNLYSNVFPKLLFLDEVTDYPTVCVYSSDESRQYMPSRFKWAFLTLNIKVYVQDEEPVAVLEDILEDIEYVIDINFDKLEYSTGETIEDMRIVSISTDEGVLAPIGVGELTVIVRYDLQMP